MAIYETRRVIGDGEETVDVYVDTFDYVTEYPDALVIRQGNHRLILKMDTAVEVSDAIAQVRKAYGDQKLMDRFE